MSEKTTKKPEVTLSGSEGNCFTIIGRCIQASKDAGWFQEKINVMRREMMSGDYDKVIQTAMKYFDVR